MTLYIITEAHRTCNHLQLLIMDTRHILRIMATFWVTRDQRIMDTGFQTENPIAKLRLEFYFSAHKIIIPLQWYSPSPSDREVICMLNEKERISSWNRISFWSTIISNDINSKKERREKKKIGSKGSF